MPNREGTFYCADCEQFVPETEHHICPQQGRFLRTQQGGSPPPPSFVSPPVVVKFEEDVTHHGSERFHQVLKEMGELHDRKQADYGRPDDPFANVRGSQDWGVPAWVGAMVRANDKVRRLQQYARTGSLANEGARDSFMDLAVYAIIGLVLWEEEQTNGNPALLS